jgi:TRAP-type C4-dicarboxylate transport system substrate-binding protein
MHFLKNQKFQKVLARRCSMLKKRFLAFVCGCFAVLLPMVMAAGPGYCATVELTYSIFFPATHGHTVLATEWAKEIEKRTNGAVKINMYPGATLTPPDQCYDGVVKGISDIGMSVLSYTKGRFPLTEVIDLPQGYKSGSQVTNLCNAYYEKFKPKELADTQIMYLHGHGPGIFHTKKPVNKMEDLKGMKIRCTGTSKSRERLGATPVAMPQTETYDAFKRRGRRPCSPLKPSRAGSLSKDKSLRRTGSSLLLLCCHEQEEMGFPAQGRPGNHSKS